MRELIEFIQNIGAFSLNSIWFPMLIWTACCLLAFWALRVMKNLNPLFQYHLRTAALLSLPLGTLISFLLKLIPEWLSKPDLETAFFIVQSPIELITGPSASPVQQSINWNEPNFYIGVITLFVFAVSLIMLVRFIAGYLQLKKLYRKLDLLDVSEISEVQIQTSIKVAFQDHPLVPFTFGWKNPVIVLPDLIRSNSEKLRMALQHELIHIQRGDYLLQLALSIVESVFWFHPLIHFANREIDIYREISCDQEVLSKSGFSIKSYANLLYELVPLNTGTGKLSVSMAVQNSTLKQRIKTMKHHKLYHTSFKRSLLFLLLMVIGITLPIACSDLRGPEIASYEELEKTRFHLNDVKIEINSTQVTHLNNAGITSTGLTAFVVNTGEYGIFKISPARFDGAKQAGKIDGYEINFKLNQMDVRLISDIEILPDLKESDVWVQHSLAKTDDFSHSSIGINTTLEEFLTAFDKSETKTDDFFVVVEEMPQPIGGVSAIQSKVEYPEMARRAGIEGRVTVQFVVNENGDVENARVVRGIGGGCDEAALKVVREAKFKPGKQRGLPVRVQFALSINFRLSDADYSNATELEQVQRELMVKINQSEDGTLRGQITDTEGNPLSGATVSLSDLNKGTATDMEGRFKISNLAKGNHTLEVSYIGFKKTLAYTEVK